MRTLRVADAPYNAFASLSESGNPGEDGTLNGSCIVATAGAMTRVMGNTDSRATRAP